MNFVPILKAIRIPEIAIKTGFILIGAFMNMAIIAYDEFIILTELFLVSMLSGVGIYGINAYYGYDQDSNNERLDNLSAIPRKTFLSLALITCTLSLVWMGFRSLNLLALTSMIFVSWTLYVHPAINLKGRFLGGVILVFVVQLMHFAIGVMFTGTLGIDLFLISIFYSILFISGHLWHELIDWDADIISNNRTTAIVIGKYQAAWLAELFFLVSTVYWAFLGFTHVISVKMMTPYIIAYILQKLAFYYFKIQDNQEQERILKFRKVYMLIYFLATLWMLYPKLDL